MQKKADTPSFDEIYKTYGDRILNLAYGLTADEDVARDLTQDIFLKVYQNLETFEQRSHIFTWLYRIAVNHITNHLKRERRRRWLSIMDERVADLIREEKVDPAFRERVVSQPAERKLEVAERAEIVWAAVRSLPAKYRVPLVLSHYERLSYKDIADTMGLSLSAVESRIHRAKKQLIKKLEPWLDHI
ncbi:MAG: sigma-70 family RNA polymerase sigma factor [Candidatus Latescibacterota bacterium]|nr:MAG: sigma-70 family RNA polymerase sigma factor [Candidatus Latescibacterota bacterium]